MPAHTAPSILARTAQRYEFDKDTRILLKHRNMEGTEFAEQRLLRDLCASVFQTDLRR